MSQTLILIPVALNSTEKTAHFEVKLLRKYVIIYALGTVLEKFGV